jgi:hypothetical protein
LVRDFTGAFRRRFKIATRYIGSTSTQPRGGGAADIVGASSGGTLAGSQKVQLVWDDSVFGSTIEGKQRLIAAVDAILAKLQTAKVWPIDSTS